MESNHAARRIIAKETVTSPRLDKPRNVRVFLPPGYDQRMSYPVVYCQDGEQFFNFGRIATVATELMLTHEIKPIIIVGVDVDVRIRTSEYSPEGERFAAYTAFFIEELIPYIESRYPVRDTSEGRVAAGDSLGGTVSLHLAMDNPSVFNRVLSFSGAFLDSTQYRIQLEQDLSDLDLYMLIGLQETEVETSSGTFNFLEHNRTAHQLLAERGAEVAYYEAEGTHLWGFWQKHMAEALRHFFK